MSDRIWRYAMLGLLGAAAWPAAADAQGAPPSTRQLTVDLSKEFRPATHVASGSLYGLGKRDYPASPLLIPTRPVMFTQMAPGGTQVPMGDALVVAPLAAEAGAKVTIRLPDIYPNFPYKWLDWDDWYAKVDSVVDTRIKSGADNIYAYELWNEPNWTWNIAAAGSFLEGWKKTFSRVRAKDRTTPIMGPSIDRYDAAFLKDFLLFAKANEVMPDIISWHELGFPEGTYQDIPNTYHIKRHIADYRALEASLGIAPLRISINEYGVTTEEAVPGSMVRYFAQFERGGVESANVAFWFAPGRLSNLITEGGEANGGWWLFKWYGDMDGQMVMTAPAAENELSLDGIASIDSEHRQARILFGGADGDNLIVVKGFGPAFRGTAHVVVEATPWYGPDVAVKVPAAVLEGDFTIEQGQIVVPLTGLDRSSGYRMTVRPAVGGANTRFEAEQVSARGVSRQRTATASDTGYLAAFGGAGQSVQFAVTVERAGDYEVQVRYANSGEQVAVHRLSANRATPVSIDYPRTGGLLASEQTGVAKAVVTLKRGINRLQLLPENGTVDLDYLQIAEAPVGSIRIEAEKAAIADALIEPSSYASGQYFVAPNNAYNSHVEFAPVMPAAGTYIMEVGYASPTIDEAAHLLTVNGRDVGRVVYLTTGARFRAVPTRNPRRIVSVPVTLNTGRNTIRLAYRGEGYVELDYIELRPDETGSSN